MKKKIGLCLTILLCFVATACNGVNPPPTEAPQETAVPIAVTPQTAEATVIPESDLPLPSFVNEVLPEITACFARNSSVGWDGLMDMVTGVKSSANVSFDPVTQTAKIYGVKIANDIPEQYKKVAFMKELCYTAAVVHNAMITGCVTWTKDNVLYCEPDDVFASAIDAHSLAYISVEDQAFFLGKGTPTHHLKEGEIDFSCDAVKIYKNWSQKGIIVPGNWDQILTDQKCP